MRNYWSRRDRERERERERKADGEGVAFILEREKMHMKFSLHSLSHYFSLSFVFYPTANQLTQLCG